MCQPVEDLIINQNDIYASSNSNVRCDGVILQDGSRIESKCVVITTGTFLRGQINIGLDIRPAGRIGDEPAIGLAKSLEALEFRMSRLRTGTPPRIKSSSINFKVLEAHYGDNPPVPFSFMNDSVLIKPSEQLPCHLTYTGEAVNKIVYETLNCNRHVTEEVTGPRYCPSIESKILRFGNKPHQVLLK